MIPLLKKSTPRLKYSEVYITKWQIYDEEDLKSINALSDTITFLIQNSFKPDKIFIENWNNFKSIKWLDVIVLEELNQYVTNFISNSLIKMFENIELINDFKIKLKFMNWNMTVIIPRFKHINYAMMLENLFEFNNKFWTPFNFYQITFWEILESIHRDRNLLKYFHSEILKCWSLEIRDAKLSISEFILLLGFASFFFKLSIADSQLTLTWDNFYFNFLSVESPNLTLLDLENIEFIVFEKYDDNEVGIRNNKQKRNLVSHCLLKTFENLNLISWLKEIYINHEDLSISEDLFFLIKNHNEESFNSYNVKIFVNDFCKSKKVLNSNYFIMKTISKINPKNFNIKSIQKVI